MSLFKLYLDPGHGGSDPGAIGNGLQEKDITLAISKKIRDILASEYDGVAVKMSRTGDTYSTPTARATEANNWGAHFYLSIHGNAGGGTGFESFTYPGTTKQYQQEIHSEIMKVIGLVDRGQKQKDLAVLRVSSMPAVLTECGFIDSTNDSTKMKDNNWINSVARAHVVGLEKAFRLKRKSSIPVAENVPNQSAVSLNKAKAKGIIQGFADGSMRPDEPVTRAQLAIILDRLKMLD